MPSPLLALATHPCTRRLETCALCPCSRLHRLHTLSPSDSHPPEPVVGVLPRPSRYSTSFSCLPSCISSLRSPPAPAVSFLPASCPSCVFSFRASQLEAAQPGHLLRLLLPYATSRSRACASSPLSASA